MTLVIPRRGFKPATLTAGVMRDESHHEAVSATRANARSEVTPRTPFVAYLWLADERPAIAGQEAV